MEDAAYWKSRFDVVEGKYKAEVPRLAEEVRLRREAHEKLGAELEELKSKAAPAAPPAPLAEVKVPAELIEKYGEEFVADMKKIIPPQAPVQQSQIPPDVATKKDVEELRQRDFQRARREFFVSLDSASPTWRALNTDTAFLDWLAGVDDFSGRTRQNLFDDAYTSLDVKRVGNFFNSFAGTQTQSGSGQQAAPPPPIEHQLAPAQNRSESPPAGKKIWTAKEIEQFYMDARKGAYRGKAGEAEFARIEHEIFTAKREGRLRA